MRNDIFKRTFCKKCNFAFDQHLKTCPKCNEENDDFIEKRCRNPLFFLDLLRCLSILFGWMILMYVVPFIVSLIVQSINPELLKSMNLSLGLNLAVYIIGFISFGWILRNYKKIIFKDFCKVRNLIVGLIAGILLIGLSQLISFLMYDLGGLPTNSNQLVVEDTVKNSAVLSFFVVVIFGPIFEELVFRVGLMGLGMKFSEKYGKIWAYVISIFVFIFIHLNFMGENINLVAEFAAIPSYFIGAGLLCLAYDQGGLSSSIIAHIMNNLLGYILVMVM